MEDVIVKKGFDINRHSNHLFVIDCLKDIVNNRYTYTITSLAELLDLREPYIQKHLLHNLDTLYLTSTNKKFIRILYKQYLYNIVDENMCDSIYDLLEMFLRIHNIDVLQKRVLIKEQSVDELIMMFKKDKGNNNLVDLDEQDLYLIRKHGVYSTVTLKEKFGFKYDTQLYRYLKNKPHIKYVLENYSDRPNLARYLII